MWTSEYLAGSWCNDLDETTLVYVTISDRESARNEELPEDLILSPTTSHLEACQFVVADHTAQLGLWIVHWLEGLASKVLDLDNEKHTVQGVCSYFHVEGAHTLLSFLAEPLKQPTETLLSTEDHDVSENLREFQDWIWFELIDIFYFLGKENPWLVPTEDHVYESVEPLFLELHAIAMLCLPSGECMCPDATLCATLMSALYSSVRKEVVLNRQLMLCWHY
ncbi:hypothetical protein ACSBR1_017280 [Camellia fascicularis]